MPIPLSCSCGARMSAPDSAAGKKVKCPKCGAAITVPAPASAFEVVDEDEAPPPPPKKAPVKATRPAVVDDDDEDTPRKKTRKKAAKAGGVPGWAWAVGGLVGVAAIAAVLVLALGGKDDPKKDAGNAPPPGESGKTGDGRATGGNTDGGNTAPTTPPDGWCEVRDPVGGYRVFLPGDKPVSPAAPPAGEKETRATGCYAAVRNPTVSAEVRTFSLLPPTGVNLGGTPDDLLAGLMAFHRSAGQQSDVVEKTPTTLGGKPALKVVLKKKPSPAPPKSPFDDDDPNSPFAKTQAAIAEREKKELAKRQVCYVTNTAERIVIVQVETPGESDPAILKTVTDSFTFL